jgi:transcriptional regulator with GAF, ATPase, and Fis domain
MPEGEYPISRELSGEFGWRTVVTAPFLAKGAPVGAISLNRQEAQPFTDREIALLETFADQAAIAIENARLFEELEQRNAQLQVSNRQVTEALEQQTATAELLSVIASSPTDLDTVLRTVAERAARLTGAAGRPPSLISAL